MADKGKPNGREYLLLGKFTVDVRLTSGVFREPYCCLMFVICLFALTLAVWPVQAAKDPAVDAFRLKVAFMWKFLQFSDWARMTEQLSSDDADTFGRIPLEQSEEGGDGGVFPDPDQAGGWWFCFSNEESQAQGQPLLGGKSYRQLPVKVVAITPKESVAHCHILFISAEDTPKYDLENMPQAVLTIGEGSAFVQRGGLIEFVVSNRRLRFKINRQRIRESGIRIDARVLRLAINVEGGQ